MDYKKFSVEDFVLDKEFRKWVLSEDPESDEFWNTWIKKNNPGKLPNVQEARRILKNLKFPDFRLEDTEKESLYQGILADLSIEGKEDTPVRYLNVDHLPPARRKRPLIGIGIAASILLCMILGLLLKFPMTFQNHISYKTDFGKTREILLGDGSKVILNANSKLYVGEIEDPNTTREVWLEGEAFFEVTHTKNHQKFIVHANKIDVNVLGTEFNVYSRGKKATISLASGKVKLANRVTKESVEMKPGDLVIYETAHTMPVRQQVNPEEVSAWRENLLIFRRTSLEEISEMLKLNYDIDVFFTNGAGGEHFFTGTTPADNVDILLETLAKSFDLEIERKGKTVIIKPTGEN